MGYFRLILAMLVASSHFENQWRPVNLGVASVIAFYFISGYLMNQSFVKFKSASNSPIMHFYIDRLLRIYPSFFSYIFRNIFLVQICRNNGVKSQCDIAVTNNS